MRIRWSGINTSGGDSHHEYADFDQQWRKKLHGFNIMSGPS